MYGEQMVRMLRAVDLLSTPAGATKQELADHLGVDKRTVERLLGLLQELNFPIYDEQDSLSGKKTWRMVDTYVMKLPNITLPDIRLTLPETHLALFDERRSPTLPRHRNRKTGRLGFWQDIVFHAGRLLPATGEDPNALRAVRQIRQGLHGQREDHRRSAAGDDRAKALRGEIPLLPFRKKEGL